MEEYKNKLKSIEEVVKGKKVFITYDPEYENEKGTVIKVMNETCEVEVAGGYLITKKYQELEGLKYCDSNDVNEFEKWYEKKYAEWIKSEKSNGMKVENAVEIIFWKSKECLNSGELKTLKESFIQLGFQSSIPKIKDYSEIARDFIKMKSEMQISQQKRRY